MTTWKIIIEIIIGFLSILIGATFWSCIKTPSFFGRTLENVNELKKFISFIGKDNIIESANQPITLPEGLNYDTLISLKIRSSTIAVNKLRNLIFLFFIFILILSYYLNIIFIIINLTCFFIMWFSKISTYAKNNVFDDIITLISYIYKWYQIEPGKCMNFCLIERPKLFSNIFETVITELK